MGSSGSHRFTDYPGGSKNREDQGSGNNGSPKSNDPCAKAFSAKLEDVEHSDYFKKHGKVPAVGTNLHIALKKRVVAETDAGEVVGSLPTSRNYLAGCLKGGHTYLGTVRASNSGPPAASVSADFAPSS